MSAINFGPKVEGKIGRIENSDDLTEKDRSTLLEYARDLRVEDLSGGRIYKVLVHTRKFAEKIEERSLVDATEEDLKDLVGWVQGRDLAHSTKRDYREILKRFFKWLNDGEHPDKARWINTTRKENREKLPEDLLDEEDVERLTEAARNPRNEALVNVMWETGARPGEYLDLEVGSIKDRENGKSIVITGKTGPRRLPLVSSVPHLNTWLSQHPANEDSGAPLWCRLDGRPRERIDYDYFRKLIGEIAERAGVDKPVYPYQFRHSRATYLANHFTEAQMCQYFGWVQGSDRPATYVHLSGRDIDVTYDKLHGFAEKESERADLSPEKCPRRGEIVGGDTKFCSRCGLPLDEKTALELDRKQKLADDITSEAEDADATGSIQETVEKVVEKKLREELGGAGP